ncbi:hypothetical protein Pelo_12709 [Pelomyxa schiedti]|nr:hypothetical protein Pelo_12709 [Pelomyxa schiedti]
MSTDAAIGTSPFIVCNVLARLDEEARRVMQLRRVCKLWDEVIRANPTTWFRPRPPVSRYLTSSLYQWISSGFPHAVFYREPIHPADPSDCTEEPLHNSHGNARVISVKIDGLGQSWWGNVAIAVTAEYGPWEGEDFWPDDEDCGGDEPPELRLKRFDVDFGRSSVGGAECHEFERVAWMLRNYGLLEDPDTCADIFGPLAAVALSCETHKLVTLEPVRGTALVAGTGGSGDCSFTSEFVASVTWRGFHRVRESQMKIATNLVAPSGLRMRITGTQERLDHLRMPIRD